MIVGNQGQEASMNHDQVMSCIEEVKRKAREVAGNPSANMNLAPKETIKKAKGRLRLGLGDLIKYLVKTM